jgi:hypothetical protein
VSHSISLFSVGPAGVQHGYDLRYRLRERIAFPAASYIAASRNRQAFGELLSPRRQVAKFGNCPLLFSPLRMCEKESEFDLTILPSRESGAASRRRLARGLPQAR